MELSGSSLNARNELTFMPACGFRVKLEQLRAEPQLFVQEEHGVHGRVLVGVVALG
jgi:hypothetical protein